jgi:hypothetical protein
MATSCTPLDEDTALAVWRAEKKKYHSTNPARARPATVTIMAVVSIAEWN